MIDIVSFSFSWPSCGNNSRWNFKDYFFKSRWFTNLMHVRVKMKTSWQLTKTNFSPSCRLLTAFKVVIYFQISWYIIVLNDRDFLDMMLELQKDEPPTPIFQTEMTSEVSTAYCCKIHPGIFSYFFQWFDSVCESNACEMITTHGCDDWSQIFRWLDFACYSTEVHLFTILVTQSDCLSQLDMLWIWQ